MTYRASHTTSPINQAQHIAPTISVIGRAFHIHRFLPFFPLQARQAWRPRSSSSAIGAANNLPPASVVMAQRNCGQPVIGTNPAGRFFIGRGQPR